MYSIFKKDYKNIINFEIICYRPCIVHLSQGIVLQIVGYDACAHGRSNPDHGLLVRREVVEHLLWVLHQGELGHWGEVPVEGP